MSMSSILAKSFQVTALASALALAGCGTGGGNDTLPPRIGSTTVTNTSNSSDSTIVQKLASVSHVSVVGDSSQFYMNNGETIELTVYALNANNMGVSGVPVEVSIPNPSATGLYSTTPANLITDEAGKATITLEVKGLTEAQKTNLRAGIEISAKVGSHEGVKHLVGSDTKAGATTQPTTSLTVKALTLISTSEGIVLEKGKKVTLTVLAVSDDNNIVANAPVKFNITDPVLTGIFANTSLSTTTNERGEATLELELKSLTAEQSEYLKKTGVTVSANNSSSARTSNTLTLKGVNTDSSNTPVGEIFVTKSKENLRTGSDRLTLTIRATDSNGGVKANTPVSLSIRDAAKYGISLSKASNLVTDANGAVEVDIIQNDIGLVSKLDHEFDLVVTVNDGNSTPKEQTLTIKATGTTIINVSASKTTINATDKTIISGILVDGTGDPITNTTVELLNNEQALNPAITVTTNSKGEFVFNEITAKTLGQSSNQQFVLSARAKNSQLQSEPISLVTIKEVLNNTTAISLIDNSGKKIDGTDIEVGKEQTIQVSTPNVADGSTIYVSTTKGDLTIGSRKGSRVPVTVTGGKATVNISSSVPGTTKIIIEDSKGEMLLQDSINFISRDVKKLLLQFENSTVTTNGETKVIASVKDANDLPIKNAVVEFSIVRDESSGNLSTASAKTDQNGIASISYYAGGTNTSNGGVTIRASVNSVLINEKETNVPTPQQTEKKLTVQSTASYISFGQSDKLIASSDHVWYIRNSAVFVNNNIGRPAINQEVSIEFVPTSYNLGEWIILPAKITVDSAGDVVELPKRWGLQYSTSRVSPPISGSPICANEDDNLNGILDSGEDRNNNGKLDPIGYVTILSQNGNDVINGKFMRTDSTGKLDFSIRYTKEVAEWMTGKLKVTTRVDGTEYVNYQEINLPVLESDLDIDKGIRPNTTSPFGTITKGHTTEKNVDEIPYCQ